jgi:hypothetical protein
VKIIHQIPDALRKQHHSRVTLEVGIQDVLKLHQNQCIPLNFHVTQEAEIQDVHNPLRLDQLQQHNFHAIQEVGTQDAHKLHLDQHLLLNFHVIREVETQGVHKLPLNQFIQPNPLPICLQKPRDTLKLPEHHLQHAKLKPQLDSHVLLAQQIQGKF